MEAAVIETAIEEGDVMRTMEDWHLLFSEILSVKFVPCLLIILGKTNYYKKVNY